MVRAAAPAAGLPLPPIDAGPNLHETGSSALPDSRSEAR